jgi:tRNA(Ile)-lysidine synthase
MKSALKDIFLNTIKKNNMLIKGDSVLIALSGGVDSTVMTCLLNEIREQYDLKLYAFHLNHMIRKREAKREAEFVKGLCDDLLIRAFLNEYDVKGHAKKHGLSVQAAAREVRYRMLEEIKTKYKINKIATAHNADDRVETVLIRMLRGTAGANISGIAPVRDGYIIRPLIDAFKDDIRDYAKKNKIVYMEDLSNRDTKYLRNRVRLLLIPYLKKNYNDNIRESILSLSKVSAFENDFINKKVNVKYEGCLLKKTGKELTFSIKKLLNVEKAVLNRILTRAYYSIAPVGHTITFKHIEKISYILGANKPNLSYRLPGGVTVTRAYDELKFTSSDTLTSPYYEYEHSLNDTTGIKEAGLKVKSELVTGAGILDRINKKKDNEEYLDAGKLTYPLTVRNFKAGDTIRPLNMKGHKKLKDIYIDKKVPVKDRRTLPVLVSGGELVLVFGVVFSDRFKVTKATKSAVRFSLIAG